MGKGRLEAFSDGVIAIILTIMVLELHVPKDQAHRSDPRQVLPAFLSYILCFVYIGVYWNNHHHLLHATKQVGSGVLWANLHLLFWLSLVPFATGWMGENHFAPTPTSIYGVNLFMCGASFWLLQREIIQEQGKGSLVRRALGDDLKGKMSLAAYALAIPFAHVRQWISGALYDGVALLWLVPDRRIALASRSEAA